MNSWVFTLEEPPKRPASLLLSTKRPSSLLLASISEAASKNAKQNPLRLPALRLSFPKLGSPRPASEPGTPTRRTKHHMPHAVGHASQEVQRLVAMAGGLLVAGISKAAQHLARHHPDKQRSNLPFYQSFAFPWNNRGNIKESCRESEALARNLIERGRKYERAFDVRAAVQCFEEAAKLSPTNLESLCLAAKQWSDLTFYHDVRSDRERQLVNLKAVEYAERAIAAYPDNAGGYMGSCISKGRLALFCDNRSKVRLAKEAQDAAATALRLAPTDDIALHLMGRWHYEMAKINVVIRAVVRVMYGTALQPGTREEALALYRRAIEVAPHRLVHHTEYGRVALELGQTEEAREALLKALSCEVEDINAWHTRFDAEMLMARIERRAWRQPSLVPPGQVGAPRRAASLSTAALLGIEEGAVEATNVVKTDIDKPEEK